MAWSHGELIIYQGAVIRTSWRERGKEGRNGKEWGLKRRRTEWAEKRREGKRVEQ